ncbi:pyridoxal phosphate-dependent aminotransferase [Novosphingobium sp. BL-8A]|uniref:pyridoxal phosphate-dependent aminotransferase n=1 Tax=Novosphingobium sp. BL-8A TaxID=3127639 RepID=UPI003756A6A2
MSDALKLGAAHGGKIVSLFDSSVPEPRALLRETMVRAIAPELGDKVVTAFGGGNRFVLDALSAKYTVPREQVLCTSGATASLALIYHTFAAPGDHVLIERPGFDLFADLAVDLGIEWEGLERQAPDFSIDVDAIEAMIRPNTRLIVLSNLHNPSGMAIEHEKLDRLAQIAHRRGVVLVVDEVYADYASEAQRPVPAFRLSPAVVSISSLTKIFGLGNLRCGWLIADRAIVDAVREVSMRIDFGVSSLSHAMAAYVFEEYDRYEEYSHAIVGEARPIFEEWFERLMDEGLIEGHLPDAGCIAFPRIPAIVDTEVFSRWLLERSGVLVAPGGHFGAPQNIRIGFAHKPGVLRQGLAALEEGIRIFASQASEGKIIPAPALSRE